MYIRSSPSKKHEVTETKRRRNKERKIWRKRKRDRKRNRENSTSRNYYEIAKKLMIINEALNRVTSRRIERRFLPSVRAASENANRKRIQDLSLEVIRVRSWGGGGGEVKETFFFFKSTIFSLNIREIAGVCNFFINFCLRRWILREMREHQ